MTDFGVTPVSDTTLAVNTFPVSAVYVPNTANSNLTAVEGMGINTDGNNQKSSGMRIGLKDGDDVAQGLMTDAAVTGDTSGTISGKLRGLTKIFTDVWDSVNHRLHVNIDAGSLTANAGTNLNTSALALEAGGNLATLVTQTATPNVSDRWARQLGQVDLARVLGAALSNTNPVIIEPNIQNWLRNAQVFTATTGANAGASQTSGANLFNASTSKSALIFSVFVMNSNPGQGIFTSLRKVTANPSYTNTITPVDNVLSSSATSLMTGSWQASATVSGTDLGTINDNSVNSKELLANGRAFILGNGANSGLSAFVGQGSTGGFWSVTFTYAEF